MSHGGSGSLSTKGHRGQAGAAPVVMTLKSGDRRPPSLPSSTPAPGPKGRSNAYATSLPAALLNATNNSSGNGNTNGFGQTGELGNTVSTINSSPAQGNNSRSQQEQHFQPRKNNFTGTESSALATTGGGPDGVLPFGDSGAFAGRRTDAAMPTISSADLTVSANRVILERMATKLPFDVRETLFSIVQGAMALAESSKRQAEVLQRETIDLRGRLHSATSEVDILAKRCEKYRDKLKLKNDYMELLIDEDKTNQAHKARELKSMNRLAKTNRVLIAAFEALGGSSAAVTSGRSRLGSSFGETADNGGSGTLIRRNARSGTTAGFKRRASSADFGKLPNSDATTEQRTEEGVISAPTSPERPATTNGGFNALAPTTAVGGLPEEHIDEAAEIDNEMQSNNSQGGKIRASLIRMSRDYYKMVKNVDLLQLEVEHLTANLKTSEKRNRQLQIELEELREANSIGSEDTDDQPVDAGVTHTSTGMVHGDQGDGAITKGHKKVKRTLDGVDSKLQLLLQKAAFDPLDGIRHMRLIVRHFANIPSSLLHEEIAFHICARSVCKMFEVDLVCLFVLQPGGEEMWKYTSRKLERTTYAVGAARSVAEKVLKSGVPVKVNSSKSSQYQLLNHEVDGCREVRARKMLCVPLFDASKSRIVGCLQFINKNLNYKFSEADELFALMYGDLSGAIIASSLLFSRLWNRDEIISNLLESSTSIFTCVSDSSSISSQYPLGVDQVLVSLEAVCRKAMNCFKCKVFLESGAVGEPPGSMVTLEDDGCDSEELYVKRKNQLGEIHKVVAGYPGIAGHVVRTGTAYILENQHSDPLHNPEVDLDSSSSAVDGFIFTVPVKYFDGTTMGCIQMIRGARSPAVNLGSSTHDVNNSLTGRILFPVAAEWLAFQISSALNYVIAKVGMICTNPLNLPQELEPLRKINQDTLFMIPRSGVATADQAAGSGKSAPYVRDVPSSYSLDIGEFEAGPVRSTKTADAFPLKSASSDIPTTIIIQDNNNSSEMLFHKRASEDNIRQENETLTEDIRAFRLQVDEANQKQLAYQAAMADLENENANLKESIRKLEARIHEYTSSENTSDVNQSSDVAIANSELVHARNLLKIETEQLKKQVADLNETLALKDAQIAKAVDDASNKSRTDAAAKLNASLQSENDMLLAELSSLRQQYDEKPTGLASLTNEEREQFEVEVSERVQAQVTAELTESHEAELEVQKRGFLEQLSGATEVCERYQRNNKEMHTEAELLKKKISQSETLIDELRKAVVELSKDLEDERRKRLKTPVVIAPPPGHRSPPGSAKRQAPDFAPPSGLFEHRPAPSAPAHLAPATAAPAASAPNAINSGDADKGAGSEGSKPAAVVVSPRAPPTARAATPPVPTPRLVKESPRLGDWSRILDESSGHYYYHNSATGETTWDAPPGFAPPDNDESHHSWHGFHQELQRLGAWVQYFDEQSQAPYWRNEETGDSKWELSDEDMAAAGGRHNYDHLLANNNSTSASANIASSGSAARLGGVSAHSSVSSKVSDYEYKIEL